MSSKSKKPAKDPNAPKIARPSYQAVDPREFVRVWQEAASVSTVAKHFKWPNARTNNLAKKLRNEGVELKKFSRGGTSNAFTTVVDAAELNAIIAGE